MFLRFKTFTACALLTMIGIVSAAAQDDAAKKDEPKPAPTATEKKDEPKPQPTPATLDLKNPTAEQIAETAIFVYGLGGGRVTLNQIRKTSIERGKINVATADGKMESASYQKWTLRADNFAKEKIRLEQEFPNATYSLVFNDEKIFGIYNDSVFTPREDASKAFENQIVRGIEALLRYKENESKLELAGQDKILGVDFHRVDVIDKQNRRTRFYVSQKTYRVMMLDYEENGIKYRRKFYDYNNAQGTLVPYRTVLWADDKIVEEIEVSTITFGQKVDENLFKSS